MTERSGIEIDYCPKCRGIWLDRGELDKLIDYAAREIAALERGADPRGGLGPAYGPLREERREGGLGPAYGPRRDYDDDDWDERRYGKRKRSVLGEIFDIFD